jgi:endo-1,3(4)-beta-glucanase
LILSAAELDTETVLTTDTHLPFSVNINLKVRKASKEPKVTYPIVQGMAFVTAGFRDAMPMIQTGGRGFANVSKPLMQGTTVKYRIKDYENRDWLVYVNPASTVAYDASRFLRIDANTLLGPPAFRGTIQAARNPIGAKGEAIYDRAAGTFATEVVLTAVVDEARATYSFNHKKVGTSPLLIFALPHHIQSLEQDLNSQVTDIKLRTSTKGSAKALWTDKLTCIETNLPFTMSFGPWSPNVSANTKIHYPPDVFSFISAVAERDMRRAMADPIPPDSHYFAGKALARLATIIWVTKDVLGNDALASAGLAKLEREMEKYIENQQWYPLYYDDSWKGIVSFAGFRVPSADHGNTYYNDHHFHSSYFVYTSAVIGYLNPQWLEQGHNKAWTNMLVKDYAESDYNSRDYPFQRSFDW